MPIYVYKCTDCTSRGHGIRLYERYLPVARYDELTTCPVCEAVMVKVITSPNIHVPNPAVLKAIAEANAKDEVIREPGMAKEAKKNKEYQEEKMRERVKKVVVDTVMSYDF